MTLIVFHDRGGQTILQFYILNYNFISSWNLFSVLGNNLGILEKIEKDQRRHILSKRT